MSFRKWSASTIRRWLPSLWTWRRIWYWHNIHLFSTSEPPWKLPEDAKLLLNCWDRAYKRSGLGRATDRWIWSASVRSLAFEMNVCVFDRLEYSSGFFKVMSMWRMRTRLSWLWVSSAPLTPSWLLWRTTRRCLSQWCTEKCGVSTPGFTCLVFFVDHSEAGRDLFAGDWPCPAEANHRYGRCVCVLAAYDSSWLPQHSQAHKMKVAGMLWSFSSTCTNLVHR